ncbi:alpha/beta fold hydrolase [Corynebacterium stationis]|uniref:Hydrolase n=1 Tax=Corynebacterium stationis TaxID=1705 RepID=A0A177ICU7_9CORY|nr:alpha/beta hydrolase [Corynebacterium stationis]NME89056.1 alpha/beta hydrolase [Corynebacterium stationis]OAH26650.1 hydrolase [Corynebacterium stationis]HCM79724.1 alpha/beta hydrolase [Corynebacterium stationis]
MTAKPLSPSVVELKGDFEHEFVHTHGIRLHVVTAGEKGDPLIVLIHGSFGGWFEFRDVIAPLASKGFRVAAVDLRGFGMSDKPPSGGGQDIRTLTGDISGIIQALGYDKAIVVGNDTGASLAWTVAIDKPERVSGVVSISGAFPVDLRRSIAARPWDFLYLLASSFWCRLPVHTVPQKFYKGELDNNTSSKFRKNNALRYEEFVRLRQLASQIGNVQRGAIYNHRLLTSGVPLRWLERRVESPVLFLHSGQRLWLPVIRRARTRVASNFTESTVAQAKNMPHLENPTGFVEAIGSWLRLTP